MATARIVLVLVVCLVTNGAPVEPGACCLSNGECFILDGDICDTVPGSFWAGAGTDCFDRDGGGSPDACFPAKERMFWVSLGDVFRSNHDGSNIEKLRLHGVTHLLVDADRSHLYWYDQLGVGEVMRSDFNGENITVLMEDGSPSIRSMSLDLGTRNIYLSGAHPPYMFPMDIPEDQRPLWWGDAQRFSIGSALYWTIARPSACDSLKMDANGDGRIDLRDYAAFQRCLSNRVDDE